MKILNNNELAEISQEISTFGKAITKYVDSIDTVIKNLDNEEVANVFYASGKFGTKQKTKLQELRKALNEYKTAIVTDPNSLVSATQKYVTKLTETNNSQGRVNAGGSTGSGAGNSGPVLYEGGQTTPPPPSTANPGPGITPTKPTLGPKPVTLTGPDLPVTPIIRPNPAPITTPGFTVPAPGLIGGVPGATVTQLKA